MTATVRRKLARRLAAARGLDSRLQEGPADDSAEQERTIPPVTEGRVLPLSHAQERMWFLHQLDPAASAYNVCVLWHLEGDLDTDALQKSAERLTDRHGVFRTLYHTDEVGGARQRVLPELPPEWRREDLAPLPQEQRAERLHEIAQRASTAPFDLASRSTLRLVLVRLSDVHHVLVMVGQHIVWDGPSFGVFSRELADGYNLYRRGEPDLYPSPPAQYIDFADWHRRQWQEVSDQRSSELAFWKSQLSPLPAPLDFPVDFERGVNQDENGDWCTESLDSLSTTALCELATREELTPFEVLIAAIALLMTRLARSSEVTIGTVASHRNLPELDGVIGNFGNVVPLRLSVSGEWTFRQLLRHCAERCRDAFAHADVPFEHLLDHLQITRGESRSPLLDTMVTFLNRGMEPPEMDGLNVHWEKHFNGTSQIDLSFDALLQNGRLQLQATWRRSLYRPETIPAHLRRLARLLRECVASPDSPLAEQTLLLPDEHEKLTQSRGERKALGAEADTLTARFEESARRQPDATAVCQALGGNQMRHAQDNQSGSGSPEEPRLTFAELNARANVLARWLADQGIGPEDRVAISLPRRAEWFVAMLATLKAGASFVPIDPAYPPDYIDRVLKLARPALKFVDNPAAPEKPPEQAAENRTDTSAPPETTCIGLDEAENTARQRGLPDHDLADAERCRPLRPAHPLCVVFTSGSSGAPKGVVVTHSAMVNLLNSHREDLYQEATRRTGRGHLRVGHAWSLAFDASWQPTLWMFDGHEIHLFDTAVMQDPIALAREIILRRLDFIELTPGMLGEVLPWLQSGLTETDGRHLEGHVPAVIGFGGESVKQAQWQRIVELEGTAGFNLYGPTEATVDALIARAAGDHPPNIGGPVAGAQAHVLDTCLQLAPPGVAGELAIAGAGLARGYLARGDLTACQFIANPHGPPGSRLYRTGDRVRWLPGGILEYIGRIDEQVKIRGFRVEPLEVEASMEKIVRRPCAVVARQAANRAMQLLCFIETGSGDIGTNGAGARETADVDTEGLRHLCEASLPAHLVPKYIVQVERLPRLPNGKVNRRALTIPEGMDDTPGREPGTVLEHQLCQLMAEVLGREQVSIDDGFFELGGDSISVVKLVSLARRQGLMLTARQIFDARCVARLAPQLESGGAETSSGNSQAQEHDCADTGLAVPTPLMARYLSQQVSLQRFAQIVSLPLPSDVSEPELETLLHALVSRHALLRARLVNDQDGSPCLEVPADEAQKPVKVERYQLDPGDTDTKGADTSSDAPRLSPAVLARQLCEHLNPSDGRMLAAARVEEGQGGRSALWLAVNHLVIDAGSWHILAGDLAFARMAQEQGESIALPPVPTAWRNWSAALARPRHKGIQRTADEGIQQETTDAPGDKSPNRSEPRGTLADATRKSWILPRHQRQCLATVVSRRLGLPLASLLPALTALAALRAGLLPDHCNRAIDLVVERNGREPSAPEQDLSRTVGWFAREVKVHLQAPGKDMTERMDQALVDLIRQWCGAIVQLDEPAPPEDAFSVQTDNWQLGFNYLGELATADRRESWTLQPRLELLPAACGDHWPLLHDLDVSARYVQHDGNRVLRFDALAPSAGTDESGLTRLFDELESIFRALIGSEAHGTSAGSDNAGHMDADCALANAGELKEVTPLQYEMLRHCQGDHDPWTTQMEMSLVQGPGQIISAEALQESAAGLLSRHAALRAGFLCDSASTFIPEGVELDWQTLDWRNESPEIQESRLAELRQTWHQHRFQLHRPPLLRFLALRLGDDRWRLLVNCHHLLLDGWSVPRILHEWLGQACGLPPETEPALSWTDYLDWLQSQDRSAVLRYWNRTLQELKAPSILCPERITRTPSEDLRDALSEPLSTTLVKSANEGGVSHAVLYQLAWARTLAHELNQADVVFGLFDAGRAVPMDGLETLVGLVTQLVPLRIDTDNGLSAPEQLRELQGRQFERQAQAPVRLDNLEAAHHFGEFFDTLLVVENALEGDSEASSVTPNKANAAASTPLSMVQEQTWRDSIGQAAGLFVYPGSPVELRLCYDPKTIDGDTARRLLSGFKKHLQFLSTELDKAADTAADSHGHSPATSP